MDDNNDQQSNQRRCRSNCIRPSSSSMMRAPSWNPGFGAQAGDEDDDPDRSEVQDEDEPNTSVNTTITNASEVDINQMEFSPELLKRIKLTIEFEIPTVYLKRNDQSKSSFHIYQMQIKSGPNAQWSIYKRYSQFLKFHHQLRQNLTAVKDVPFPPKKRLNSKASTIVQDRRRKLEQYMQRISDIIANLPICPADMETFQRLVALAHDRPSVSSPSPTPSNSQQAQGDLTEVSSLNGSLHSEQDQEQEFKCSDEKIPVSSARCLFYEFITPNTALDQTSV